MLETEGKALVALNAAMYAADKSDRMGALRVRMRNEKATATIWSYAVMKSLAVALNPGAVIDVLGGTAVDVTMVVTLGKIYGIEITMANARDLVTSILKAAGWVMLGEAAVSYASSLFKGLTVGYGTVLTALPQGAAAGYGSYIVGQAARILLRAGRELGRTGPEARRLADPRKHRQGIGAPAAQGRDQKEDLAQSVRCEVSAAELNRKRQSARAGRVHDVVFRRPVDAENRCRHHAHRRRGDQRSSESSGAS